jgi:hypothetical protein
MHFSHTILTRVKSASCAWRRFQPVLSLPRLPQVRLCGEPSMPRAGLRRLFRVECWHESA